MWLSTEYLLTLFAVGSSAKRALALHACAVVSLHVHSRMAGEGWEKARALLLEAVESLTQVAATLQPPGNSISNPGSSGCSRSIRASPAVQPPSRSSGYSGDSALRGHNRLFHFGFRSKGEHCGPKSKKKRLHSWKHEFICLASMSCSRVPSGIEMAELMSCGLGKKQLTLYEYDKAADIHSEILHAFPLLGNGGGYELLRVNECGARSALHVIPQPAQGYVSYLREVVRQAKVYIRPIQHDLQLKPELHSAPDSVSDSTPKYIHVCRDKFEHLCNIIFYVQDCPTEECCVCSKPIPLPQLRRHIECCKLTMNVHVM